MGLICALCSRLPLMTSRWVSLLSALLLGVPSDRKKSCDSAQMTVRVCVQFEAEMS